MHNPKKATSKLRWSTLPGCQQPSKGLVMQIVVAKTLPDSIVNEYIYVLLSPQAMTMLTSLLCVIVTVSDHLHPFVQDNGRCARKLQAV